MISRDATWLPPLLLTLVVALVVGGAAPVPRGEPARLELRNESGGALECHAVAGHWYGFDFGAIATGERRALALRYDRGSGMVSIDNAGGRAVPLEYVYCGRPGEAWATRAVLPMRPALERAAPIVCRAEAAGLRCAP